MKRDSSSCGGSWWSWCGGCVGRGLGLRDGEEKVEGEVGVWAWLRIGFSERGRRRA